MVTFRVRKYLYALDDIYHRNRKRFSNHGHATLSHTIHDFLKYWREIEAEHFPDLEEWEQDETYFFFNEKLQEIARCHLDIYWLIQDYDDLPLFKSGREPLPFWKGERRKERRRRAHQKESDDEKQS